MPTASIRGVDLFYDVTGNGEPVVLVHGAFWDHNMWMFVAPLLAESFRVVTFDWPGHGESSGDVVKDPLRVVDDLATLVEHLGIAPAHFVGQSAGAQMLVHLASRHPEIVRSLSLHEAGFVGLLSDPLHGRVRDLASKVAASFRRDEFEHGLGVFMSFIGSDWSTLPPPIQTILLQNAPNYAADWFDDPDHGLWNIEEDALRRIDVPTQLTTGDRAAEMHTAITERLANLIPGARTSVIADAGHGAMLEQPEGYVRAVADFLHASRG